MEGIAYEVVDPKTPMRVAYIERFVSPRHLDKPVSIGQRFVQEDKE